MLYTAMRALTDNTGWQVTHREPVTVTGGLPFWLVLDW
jgi:hypothetical protein